MPTIEQHAEESNGLRNEQDLIAQLTADADDRSAQLAMAIESVADEIGKLRQHVEELRVDIAAQRVVLEELSVVRRRRRRSTLGSTE